MVINVIRSIINMLDPNFSCLHSLYIESFVVGSFLWLFEKVYISEIVVVRPFAKVDLLMVVGVSEKDPSP